MIVVYEVAFNGAVGRGSALFTSHNAAVAYAADIANSQVTIPGQQNQLCPVQCQIYPRVVIQSSEEIAKGITADFQKLSKAVSEEERNFRNEVSLAAWKVDKGLIGKHKELNKKEKKK